MDEIQKVLGNYRFEKFNKDSECLIVFAKIKREH